MTYRVRRKYTSHQSTFRSQLLRIVTYRLVYLLATVLASGPYIFFVLRTIHTPPPIAPRVTFRSPSRWSILRVEASSSSELLPGLEINMASSGVKIVVGAGGFGANRLYRTVDVVHELFEVMQKHGVKVLDTAA